MKNIVSAYESMVLILCYPFYSTNIDFIFFGFSSDIS